MAIVARPFVLGREVTEDIGSLAQDYGSGASARLALADALQAATKLAVEEANRQVMAHECIPALPYKRLADFSVRQTRILTEDCTPVAGSRPPRSDCTAGVEVAWSAKVVCSNDKSRAID
jgi:hypothetical protein